MHRISDKTVPLSPEHKFQKEDEGTFGHQPFNQEESLSKTQDLSHPHTAMFGSKQTNDDESNL
jgi:hypothetical protein